MGKMVRPGGTRPSSDPPYIFVPYQYTAIQVISSFQYLNWTNIDTQRPPTVANGSTLIPGDSSTPTTLFSVPASPNFSKINIELVIEPLTYNAAISGAQFIIRKDGASLAYEGMPIVSKRIVGEGDNSSGEIFNIKLLPVSGGEVFSLYLGPTSGSIQFRSSSAVSSDATNLMYCRVEEVV